MRGMVPPTASQWTRRGRRAPPREAIKGQRRRRGGQSSARQRSLRLRDQLQNRHRNRFPPGLAPEERADFCILSPLCAGSLLASGRPPCGLQLHHDAGGAGALRQQQDAGGERGRGAGAGGGAAAAPAHRGRLRGREAPERGPRQRGALPAGHGRGGRGRRGPADPLHPHPGLLLRQRHPHPARVRDAAAGGPAGGGAGGRRAPRPALPARHEPPHGRLEGPGPGRGGQLLRREPRPQPVGAVRGPAAALRPPGHRFPTRPKRQGEKK